MSGNAPRCPALAAALAVTTIAAIALSGWPSAAIARSAPAADRLWNRGFVATSIAGDRSPFERPGQIRIYFYAHGFYPDSIQWPEWCHEGGVSARIDRHRVWGIRPEGGGDPDCPRRSQRKSSWLVRFFRAGPHWHLAGGRLVLVTGHWTMRLRPDKDAFYRG
jgi:hypothetical protein